MGSVIEGSSFSEPIELPSDAANSMGSVIEGSSFSGLLTRVEIGHIRIRSAGE